MLKIQKVRPPAGFTLIELLIVVAIIGILAAMAVPNFMNARMRSMVARVNADHQAIQTALGMYAVDNGRYSAYGNPEDVVTAINAGAITYLPVRLTTPVSYLSSLPYDPFPPKVMGGDSSSHATRSYKYIHAYDEIYKEQSFYGKHLRAHTKNAYGEERQIMYEIWSLGPDRIPGHQGIFYDISNGLFSEGDMITHG
ncbi:MAG: prepilin-type N-terminal cleavage/methylation domain-containing protein [Candidatus Omnitrophica bacterium]|nr:prepilin-type N-terminal cleavage/methylation domain-containing protein [Candidatus Omnitrophota bacterium]